MQNRCFVLSLVKCKNNHGKRWCWPAKSVIRWLALLFNIWPSTAMKICPKVFKNCQSRIKILPHAKINPQNRPRLKIWSKLIFFCKIWSHCRPLTIKNDYLGLYTRNFKPVWHAKNIQIKKWLIGHVSYVSYSSISNDKNIFSSTNKRRQNKRVSTLGALQQKMNNSISPKAV